MTKFTTADLHRMTGKSIRTLHRMVASGDLKAAEKFPGKTGGYLFRPSDVRKAFPDATWPEAESAPLEAERKTVSAA